MRREYVHHQTKEEAYQRIDQRFLEELKEEYNIIKYFSKNWNSSHDNMNFNLRILIFNLDAELSIQENKVVVEGKVPRFAKRHEEKAGNILMNKLKEILT